MAYTENVAERVRQRFARRTDVVEKKMFGGLTFMVSGHMCCGVVDDALMARVGPDQYEAALARSGARTMDFTGRTMKGMVFVATAGFASDDDLSSWVGLCLAFVETLPPK